MSRLVDFKYGSHSECEGCGVIDYERTLPLGWIGCGRSRRRINRRGASIDARWCPACYPEKQAAYNNPSERDLKEIRQRLLREESEQPSR